MNYSNNAYSVLASGITNVATSISLAPGTGSRFPASNFRVTLIGYDGSGNENAWEICHCSTRTSDTLTVTRGQEGTTAVSWASASRIEHRITAGQIGDLLEKSSDSQISGLVGLGASPVASRGRLQIAGAMAGGNPQASGSTDAAQFAALGNGNASLRMGLYSSGALWLQQSQIGNYAVNYDIAIQPSGGNVGIGKVPGALLDYRDTVSVIGVNTTAVASRTYVLTTSLTLTLPASPAAGDWVGFVNRSGTTTAVIGRNSQNIMGLPQDMNLDDESAFGVLTFADATRGWVRTR